MAKHSDNDLVGLIAGLIGLAIFILIFKYFFTKSPIWTGLISGLITYFFYYFHFFKLEYSVTRVGYLASYAFVIFGFLLIPTTIITRQQADDTVFKIIHGLLPALGGTLEISSRKELGIVIFISVSIFNRLCHEFLIAYWGGIENRILT